MNESGILGKAYEYACLEALYESIKDIRPVEIIKNPSFSIAKNCFERISDTEKSSMEKSAFAGIKVIMEMEPKIAEDGRDKLTISLQADNIAKSGDIRDIIIIRRSVEWEIGISVKHNHAALKHSRLSQHIDFGKEWFQTPCSVEYFNDITPIFKFLTSLKEKGELWKNIRNKEDVVYTPILKAFMKEFHRLFTQYNQKITKGIINYLLGSNGNDYYKLIHYDNDCKTRVIPFNIKGTLNQSANKTKPKIKIPKIPLPSRIIELCFKEESKTTIVLTMNNGWAISFRIHNASSYVEPSLKFDIQLQGQPADLFYIDTKW